MNSPIEGLPATRSETQTRINDLDSISDEEISLSMNFGVDLPTETFKATFGQLVDYLRRELINNRYLVGDIIITANNSSPSARGLTGTWVPILEQTALSSVAIDNSNLGVILGDNNPAVPLVAHDHDASTNTSGSHHHTLYLYDVENEAATQPGSDAARSDSGGNTQNTNSSGEHTHTVNINSAGEIDPTINVQGQILNCVFWRKTSNR